jgi:predicted ATP-dependent protease
MIPAANVRHLMLAPEVVAAVAESAFNVWPIATIDEGLELLADRPATDVHARAQASIAEFAALARDFQSPPERNP